MQKFVKGWDGSRIDIEDAKAYMIEAPSVGFSPEKNKAIIQKTINEAKKRRAEFMKSQEYELRERTDAVASYIKFIATHDEVRNTPEAYFGKKYLAHLRGQHILKTLFKLKTGQTGAKLGWSDEIITE